MSVSASRALLPQGEIVSHAHPYAHIIIPLEEPYYIRFLGHERMVTADEVCFVPPETIHSYSSTSRALTLNLSADNIKTSDLVFLTENCVRKIDENLEPVVSLIRHEVSDKKSNEESLRYLFLYLYDKLVDLGRLPSLRYIEENYSSDITIRELAALENYNISYYTEWFKKNVGCLPSEYLRMVRIDKAKEILASGRTHIVDVALQVGYYNSSSFTRAFREVEGITPNQYRKKIFDLRDQSNEESIPNIE